MLPDNIALNQPAWRSHNDTRWLPSNAVDGDTNTMAYVYHAAGKDEEYWDFVAIDLGRRVNMQIVMLKLSVDIGEYQISWNAYKNIHSQKSFKSSVYVYIAEVHAMNWKSGKSHEGTMF